MNPTEYSLKEKIFKGIKNIDDTSEKGSYSMLMQYRNDEEFLTRAVRPKILLANFGGLSSNRIAKILSNARLTHDLIGDGWLVNYVYLTVESGFNSARIIMVGIGALTCLISVFVIVNLILSVLFLSGIVESQRDRNIESDRIEFTRNFVYLSTENILFVDNIVYMFVVDFFNSDSVTREGVRRFVVLYNVGYLRSHVCRACFHGCRNRACGYIVPFVIENKQNETRRRDQNVMRNAAAGLLCFWVLIYHIDDNRVDGFVFLKRGCHFGEVCGNVFQGRYGYGVIG